MKFKHIIALAVGQMLIGMTLSNLPLYFGGGALLTYALPKWADTWPRK